MATPLCVNCGREVKDLPDARKEGKDWFCSQSCYLLYASRVSRRSPTPANRGGSGGASAAPIDAGAGFRPGRAIWKTIKVVVATVVLVVVALVIILFVVIGKAAHDLEKPAGISRTQFRHVRTGFTHSRVRAMLGTPTDRDTKQDAVDGERCWYYGSIFSTGRAYAVCFKHDKVSDKYRVK